LLSKDTGTFSVGLLDVGVFLRNNGPGFSFGFLDFGSWFFKGTWIGFSFGFLDFGS
jgi:hypothetical protein